jgi:hypothetical protein
MDMLWNLAWMSVGALLGILMMALAQMADEDKDNDTR